MLIANYHTHTTLCRHAKGDMREYVENAVKAGIKELGFSDHAPQIFPEEWGYYSTFRMFPEQTAQYVESVRELAKEYAADIRILVGFETEYYPALFDALLAHIRPFDVDYMILGQHSLDNEVGSIWCTSPTAKNEDLEKYVSQVLEGLRTGRFTYLAHPDVLNFTGDEAFYAKEMRRLCLGAKELAIPLEINLLGIRDGRPYPSECFFRIAAECGCIAILGCDAHSPAPVADFASAERATEMAKRLGLSLIDRITPIPPTRD